MKKIISQLTQVAVVVIVSLVIVGSATAYVAYTESAQGGTVHLKPQKQAPQYKRVATSAKGTFRNIPLKK